jgi:hypothetical protein
MQTRLLTIGIDIENVEMVTTDDRGCIQPQFQDFVKVFSKVKAETLRPHWPTDHAIHLELGYKLPYGQIYNLSEFELKTLKAYTETNLASHCIQWSSSLAAAPTLLLRKKDRGPWFRCDHRCC